MKTMNAEMLRKMFLAGAANIEAKKEFINNSNYNPEDYNNEEDLSTN